MTAKQNNRCRDCVSYFPKDKRLGECVTGGMFVCGDSKNRKCFEAKPDMPAIKTPEK